MKYYFINYSVEKKVVGKFFQSTMLNSPIDFKLLYLQMELSSQKGGDWQQLFRNFNFELNIYQSSKLTTILSSNNIGRGLVILGQHLKIICNFNLPINIVLPVDLFIQKKRLLNAEYFWFNPEPVDLNLIDFQNSNFYIKLFDNSILEDFKVENAQELVNEIKKQPWDLSKFIYPKELFLKSNFNYDLFRFDFFEISRILISERLMNKMIEEGFTGIEFKEPKHFKITRL